MIRFACPGCGASLRVPESLAGKTGTCPKCGAEGQVPHSTPETGRTAPARGKAAPASGKTAPTTGRTAPAADRTARAAGGPPRSGTGSLRPGAAPAGATSAGRCPRCAAPLERGAFRQVEASCCKGCQGLLLPTRELRRLLEGLGRELISAHDPDVPIDPLPDTGGALACPGCATPMEHYGYMGSAVVKIDSCGPCGRTWVDADELGVMALLMARTNLRREELLRAAAERQAASDRNLDALALAEEMRGMVLDHWTVFLP